MGPRLTTELILLFMPGRDRLFRDDDRSAARARPVSAIVGVRAAAGDPLLGGVVNRSPGPDDPPDGESTMIGDDRRWC
jgi:hypothetical protein